ncbi:unnamed protein product [Clonostachys solani]|uniref:Major facilitator superfamily (MFS) profile domain-containing protein n=1 Tax=Clonostachys solani TaxID=160281 RepID=A0A9N9W596_9HYPO|nr:unnamed protein product [Clonostachys solani]
MGFRRSQFSPDDPPAEDSLRPKAKGEGDTNAPSHRHSSVLNREGSIYSFFGGNEAARQANIREQEITLNAAFRYYHPAMRWAIIMAAPIILEGYDTSLMPNFFSNGAFIAHYGTTTERTPDQKIIPAYWQSAITAAATIGQLFGLLVAPKIVDRVGYRVSNVEGLLCAALCLVVVFASSFCGEKGNRAVYLTGEFLIGIPWGLFQSLALPYVSDITPLKLRAQAATMINIYWLIGQLLCCGILRGFICMGKDIWAVIWHAPDSPLYLARQERYADAAAVLKFLNRDPFFDAEGSLDAIRRVNEHEKAFSQDMGYMACFNKSNRRRTEIAVMVYLTQQLVGTCLMTYGVKLLEQSGLSEANSMEISMVMYSLCILSTLSSMLVQRRFGRRTLWLWGLGLEVVCLLVIGITGQFEKYLPSKIHWMIAGFLVLFAIIYNMTIGPLCYTIVAETPSTRLKATTNSVSRAAYITLSIGNQFLVPYLLNPKPVGVGLGPRAALVWAGTATACLIWAFFRLPEMKDRTPAEVDILFEDNLPTRHWKHTKLD